MAKDERIAPVEEFEEGPCVVLSLRNLVDIAGGERVEIDGEDMSIAFVANDDPREDIKAARQLLKVAKTLLEDVEEAIEDLDEDDLDEEGDGETESDEEDIDDDQ